MSRHGKKPTQALFYIVGETWIFLDNISETAK